MRKCNGAPAHTDTDTDTDTIEAGTELWRVHRTDSEHPANSFTLAGIAPLDNGLAVNTRKERNPRQGRFEPVHDETVCPPEERGWADTCTSDSRSP